MTAPAKTPNYSDTDKWVSYLVIHEDDLSKMQGRLVRDLPYEVLHKISEQMNPVWERYQSYAQKLAPDATNSLRFFSVIGGEKSNYTLSDLFTLDSSANSSAIANSLKSCSSLLEQRKKADQDLSKGLMSNLHPEKLPGLSEIISQNAFDWRRLSSMLGFNNTQCRQFVSCQNALERWIKLNPNATVARLILKPSNSD